VITLATLSWPVEIVAIADPNLLRQRASQLNLPVDIRAFDESTNAVSSPAGRLLVLDESLVNKATPGQLDSANSAYVLATLRRASAKCRAHGFAAMVTGPVHKGIINDAGLAFSGHTEFLAEQTGAEQPVMLLVAGDLRVALATTHLPLRKVHTRITGTLLKNILNVLDQGLKTRFGIATPQITVLGLNPHAGESGHLGKEEQEIIEPALNELRSAGINLTGPLPADTAFTQAHLADTDAVLAMYHDQGLPVLKHRGFGQAVNVTLGLPIIRTSVDHGTALELAGSGRADPGSMIAAVKLAIDLHERQR